MLILQRKVGEGAPSAELGQFIMSLNNGGILRSPDGVNWADKKATPNTLYSLEYGNDKLVGFIGGSSYVSTDIGDSWSSLNSLNIGSSQHPYPDLVTFTGSDFLATTSGAEGKVARSPDGINWTSETVETSNFMTSLSLHSTDTGLAVLTGYSGSTIREYHNAGSGWIFDGDPMGVSSTNGKLGGGNGTGLLFKTGSTTTSFNATDGYTFTPSSGSIPGLVRSVQQVGSDFYVATNSGTTQPVRIYKTTDNGNTWSYVSQVIANADIYNLSTVSYAYSSLLNRHVVAWQRSSVQEMYVFMSPDGIAWVNVTGNVNATLPWTSFVKDLIAI